MVYHPVTFSGVLYIYDAESGLFRPGMEEVRSFVQHKLSLFAGGVVCDRFFSSSADAEAFAGDR